jgi:hypothetical protein
MFSRPSDAKTTQGNANADCMTSSHEHAWIPQLLSNINKVIQASCNIVKYGIRNFVYDVTHAVNTCGGNVRPGPSSH